MEKTFPRGEKKLLKALKKRIFPLKSDDDFKEQARQENIRNENGLIDYNKFMELVRSKENEMNNEFVRKYFSVQNLENLLKQMKGLKNNPKNKIRARLIKIGLKDHKNEIRNMSEEEKKLKNQMKYF